MPSTFTAKAGTVFEHGRTRQMIPMLSPSTVNRPRKVAKPRPEKPEEMSCPLRRAHYQK